MRNIRARISKAEKLLPRRDDVEGVTKEDLLFCDYPEYRELCILALFAEFTKDYEKQSMYERQAEELAETLVPLTSSFAFDVETYNKLVTAEISRLMDEHPEVEHYVEY